MMHSKPLMGVKVAVLVANGFSEQDVTTVQRKLMEKGATIRMVSMEDHGLSHSWNGTGWGLHFAGDAVLKSALAVDFDMLVVPSGQRSIEKLKLTQHTKRFINGFLNCSKPVAVMGEALGLLIFADNIDGHSVAGPDRLEEAVLSYGGSWMDKPFCISGDLITGQDNESYLEAFAEAIVDHFISCYAKETDVNQAA